MSLHRVMEGDTLILKDGEKEILAMAESADGNAATVALRGMLRSDTLHDFQDELIAMTTLGMDLVVDFSGVTYLSTACQQALLTVQQKMDSLGKGSLTLVKLPPNIYDEFEKTGASELLMIAD